LAALREGQVLKIVDDQWGNPTLVDDLAMAILDLCCQDGRGVFHMGGATYLTRFELVVELARFFGLREELVQPIATEEAGQLARRPLKSGLKTERLTAALGRSPLGFIEGVERLATLGEFKRDFPDLRSH
jgi:dTDP-4-dehydrorhamnose reductase